VQLPGSERAVALALCCDGRAGAIDPREGGRRAVVEGVLRTAAMGAQPIGASDCLNYGNPQRPEIMWQLVEGIEGIAEACRALDVPVVSGNVSLYNQTGETAVLPTPAVAVVGLLEDWKLVAPPLEIKEGDLVVRVGTAPATLGGSLALAIAAADERACAGSAASGASREIAARLPPHAALDAAPAGRARPLDLGAVRALAEGLRGLRTSSTIKDARPVFAGGALAALAELCAVSGKGLDVAVPADEDAYAALFAEDAPQAIVIVPPARARFLPPSTVLGTVKGKALVVKQGDRSLFARDVDALVEQREAVIPAIAGAPPPRRDP